MAETAENPASVWRREEQWVSRVLEFSSQYNDSTWSANQVIGSPKVYPRHGDITGSWAQGNRANNEFIIVEFERAVYPEQIDIYETYNPGAVVRVSIRNGLDNSEWETIWETATPHVEGRSRIFPVPCRNILGREINQVRLDVNCTAANNWCEIDAIKLIGHTSMNDMSHKELISHLKQLFTDPRLTDVTFQLEDGRTISSYRNILRTRCFYFNQLFHEYPAHHQQPIPISKISFEAFYQILHYIFTDTIEPVLTFEICLELMRKADEFYLSAIYDQALKILTGVINKHNVLKIFTQTGLFPNSSDSNEEEPMILPDVVDLCVNFIRKNRGDVYSSENIKLLTKDMLVQLVQLVL